MEAAAVWLTTARPTDGRTPQDVFEAVLRKSRRSGELQREGARDLLAQLLKAYCGGNITSTYRGRVRVYTYTTSCEYARRLAAQLPTRTQRVPVAFDDTVLDTDMIEELPAAVQTAVDAAPPAPRTLALEPRGEIAGGMFSTDRADVVLVRCNRAISESGWLPVTLPH